MGWNLFISLNINGTMSDGLGSQFASSYLLKRKKLKKKTFKFTIF